MINTQLLEQSTVKFKHLNVSLIYMISFNTGTYRFDIYLFKKKTVGNQIVFDISMKNIIIKYCSNLFVVDFSRYVYDTYLYNYIDTYWFNIVINYNPCPQYT